jgi:hypothetical protein
MAMQEHAQQPAGTQAFCLREDETRIGRGMACPNRCTLPLRRRPLHVRRRHLHRGVYDGYRCRVRARSRNYGGGTIRDPQARTFRRPTRSSSSTSTGHRGIHRCTCRRGLAPRLFPSRALAREAHDPTGRGNLRSSRSRDRPLRCRWLRAGRLVQHSPPRWARPSRRPAMRAGMIVLARSRASLPDATSDHTALHSLLNNYDRAHHRGCAPAAAAVIPRPTQRVWRPASPIHSCAADHGITADHRRVTVRRPKVGSGRDEDRRRSVFAPTGTFSPQNRCGGRKRRRGPNGPEPMRF